ncbi:MAG TPA: phage major capsid protein [Solirubrobacterales bacterium]
MREGWTQDQMEDQFYTDDPLLDEIEKRGPTDLIGEYALTPIHTGRAGGVTMVPPTGSRDLNQADSQKVNQAKWKYGRIWNSVEIDTAAVQQTSSNSKAVANVVDTEVSGKISDSRKQLTRQLFLDQTGLICQTLENTTTKTLKLATSGTYGLGVEATLQGWLVKGQVIDIGTTANEVAIADGVEITGVNLSESEPSITISGSNVSTTTSHYVSLRNSRSGTTSYEINGFRNINSLTSVLGEINPSTEPGWTAAFVDTSGGPLTRNRVVRGRRLVRRRGVRPDWAFTSLKQVENLESELIPQVRYDSPKDMNMGDGESVMIGTLPVQGHEDCPEGDFNYARKDKLFALRTEKPYWVGEKFGNAILTIKQGTTFLYGNLEYFMQLGVSRRNAFGGFRGLE